MNFDNYSDLKISDDITSKGGNFRDVKIRGDAVVEGDISCRNMSISGDGELYGRVYCENDIKVSGDATFNSLVDCGNMKVYGDAELRDTLIVRGNLSIYGDIDIIGNISCNSINIMGDIESKKGVISKASIQIMGDGVFGGIINGKDIKIMGDIEECESIIGEKINIYGDVRVLKDIEGDKISIKGDVYCDGLVNGDEVYITTHGSHKIKEIGGRVIRVSDDMNKGRSFSRLFSIGDKFGSGLKCECIEGDDIMLKNSNVNIIRGHNIILGSGCVIEYVEYSGKLTLLDDAIVKEEIKL